MLHTQVHSYSKKALEQALAQAAYKGGAAATEADVERLSKLDSVTYLHGYLCDFCREEAFEAKTIVVEEEYVDRDYLTEYAGYYATSFQPVAKKTTRLHFFSEAFDEATFEQLVVDAGHPKRATLSEAYLGFVVVRPMRSNFMGRTCLRHYPPEKTARKLPGESDEQRDAAVSDTRHYTVSREYRVNLCGLPLKVTSVAFQEQDSVVGACASAALYALLHGVKPVFDTKTYSALEITRIANGYSAPGTLAAPSTRPLPSTGLTFGQMYQMLAEQGLSPMLLNVVGRQRHQADVVATLYAYLSAGLPVLAHVALTPADTLNLPGTPDEQWQKAQDVVFDAQKHAFTFVGYSMASQPPAPLDPGEGPRIEEVARQVNKFYVHCDRIGPFAKFWLQRVSEWLVLRPDALKQRRMDAGGQLSAERFAYRGIGANAIAVPVVFIVPTSEKLRLGIGEAYAVAQTLDAGLQDMEVIWDIKVSEVRNLRKEWLASKTMAAPTKLAALGASLPRFCWRIVAMLKGTREPMFEVLLDCTAVDAASSILSAVSHGTDGDVAMQVAHEQLVKNLGDVEQGVPPSIDARILTRLLEVLPTMPEVEQVQDAGILQGGQAQG